MTTSPRVSAPAAIAILLVLLLAGATRLWNLGAHDFGNIYYAAAVRSMSERWTNFLFASFDLAGVVTLDKPPAAFWVQVLSVKLLGYSGVALHLPQALLGVLNVGLVFLLARRGAGPWAGVVAALVMAVFPAAVAADRSNLPDTFLMFVLLAATMAMLRAVEFGRVRWLLLAGVLIGVGFTTKMIVAWMILPALAIAHLVCGPRTIMSRVFQLTIWGAAVAVASLAWPLAADLTPTDGRPYIGGSNRNSALERALSGFGLDRLVGRGGPGGGPRGVRPPGPPMGPPGGPMDGPGGMPPGPGMRAGVGGRSQHLTGHGGMPSVLRLGNRDLAGHGSWLLPFAILGAVTALRVGGAPRASVRVASIVLWSVWLLTLVVVFSAAGGPIHPYYLIMLGPPIAALVGIGAVAMCPPPRRAGTPESEPRIDCERDSAPPAATAQHSTSRSLALRGSDLLGPRLGRAIAAFLLSTVAAVLILGHTPDCGRVLAPVVAAGGAGAVVVLAIAWWRASRGVAVAGLTLGLAVLLVCPTLWSWTPALAGGGRMVPIADPQLLESRRDGSEVERNGAAIRALVEYLRRGAGRANFLVASGDVHLVAPLIIETGARAVAYGGFHGHDPAITLSQLEELVARGELRYVLVSRGRGPGRMGPPRGDSAIEKWIREHGVEVPDRVWLPRELAAGPARELNMMAGDTASMCRNLYRSGATALYDCSPRGSD